MELTFLIHHILYFYTFTVRSFCLSTEDVQPCECNYNLETSVFVTQFFRALWFTLVKQARVQKHAQQGEEISPPRNNACRINAQEKLSHKKYLGACLTF